MQEAGVTHGFEAFTVTPKGSATFDLLTWSVRDAAESTGLPVKTLYRVIGRGEMGSYRIGRAVRVAPKDLKSYLARCRRSP